MVGILIDPEGDVVPPLQQALGDTNLAGLLRLRPTTAGNPYAEPSALFATAHFDTEHDRDPALCPGAIRVAHFFLPFGYATSTLKAKSPAG